MLEPKLKNTRTTRLRTPPITKKTKGAFTNGKST